MFDMIPTENSERLAEFSIIIKMKCDQENQSVYHNFDHNHALKYVYN